MKFSVKAFSGTPGVARCLCGILYAGLMCAALSLHAEVPDALLDYVEATGDQFVVSKDFGWAMGRPEST